MKGHGVFTATNGIQVMEDERGAIAVQWVTPDNKGWTGFDANETQALREFFRSTANRDVTPVEPRAFVAHDYFFTLLRTTFATLTKRERRRLMRKHQMLYFAIRGLVTTERHHPRIPRSAR